MFKINYSDLVQMYYLEYEGNYQTWSVAQKLNITKMKFVSILKKWGAIQNKCSGEFYFQYEEDAQSAIEVLESILVMEKLTE